jgi:FtsH-binding integral membrane protein
MFILAKMVGIIVLIWFAMSAKSQGEYWLRWAIVGLIGYWLTWTLLYITLSMPILPTFAALTMTYFIRKKLMYDAQKNKAKD